MCQGQIVRPRSEEAELAAEARGIGRLEAGGERVDRLLRLFDGSTISLSSASSGNSVSARRMRFHCATSG